MNNHRSILQILLMILGLAGIILIPLPFTFGESPLSEFSGNSGLWQLALPSFLAVLATLFTIRWIISGRLSRIESTGGYVAGVVSALVTLYACLLISSSWHTYAWPQFLPPLTLIVGGYVVFRNWRKGLPHGLNAWVWLQVAYLANCLYCLVIFRDELQVGGYLALLTAVVYVIQIILLCGRSGTVSSVSTR